MFVEIMESYDNEYPKEEYKDLDIEEIYNSNLERIKEIKYIFNDYKKKFSEKERLELVFIF
jgi:hypothetical protein